MNDYILEVCVDSAESALAAAKGGASRLELCQNLVIGGTTPSPKLFEVIRRQTTIPIHALIRPRFGDFCYTPYELEEIREEVAMYRELGAEGVVVGVLKEDGTMNMEAMEPVSYTHLDVYKRQGWRGNGAVFTGVCESDAECGGVSVSGRI